MSRMTPDRELKVFQLRRLSDRASRLSVGLSVSAELMDQQQNLRAWQGFEEALQPFVNTAVTCVYCGHQFPEGTPPAGADQLTEHIRKCAKHPMRDHERRLTRLTAAALLVVSSWHAGEMTHELIEALEDALGEPGGPTP